MKYEGSRSYDFAKIGSDNSSQYRPKEISPITVSQSTISYQPQNNGSFKLEGSGIRSNVSYADNSSTQFAQQPSGSNSLSQSLNFQASKPASQQVVEKSYSNWGQTIQHQMMPIQIVSSPTHQPVPYAQAGPWTGNSLSYQPSLQQGPPAGSQQQHPTQEWRPAPQTAPFSNPSIYTANNSKRGSSR